MRAKIIVLLYVATLGMRNVKCTETELLGKTDRRIDGKCTFVVENVATLDACMCYLKDHASAIEAVSFDMSSAKCIAAPRGGKYTVVDATNWFTYFLEEMDPEKPTDQKTTAPPLTAAQPRTTAPHITTAPQPSPGFAIFTSSENWTVPPGISSISGLCIGGGGGGGRPPGGGGGSGYVRNATAMVAPGSVITVTIGRGGAGGINSSAEAKAGGSSSIGVYVVASGGGFGTYCLGASGGSGGGCTRDWYWGYPSTTGGSGGNGGETILQSCGGGAGQGPTSWSSAVASVPSVKITFGAGGFGHPSVASTAPGAGGGGGITVNGYTTSAWSGTSAAPGGGGVGYGAGGGGAGCHDSKCDYVGGAGASGLCVITW